MQSGPASRGRFCLGDDASYFLSEFQGKFTYWSRVS